MGNDNKNNEHTTESACDFDHVFSQELIAIQNRRLSVSKPDSTINPDFQQSNPEDNHSSESTLQQQAWSMSLVGLSFSGGGIRSATFNLGIIQALSRLKLLRSIDYLSTVSGGGYIGSWLSAQFYREYDQTGQVNQSTRDIEEALSPDKSKAKQNASKPQQEPDSEPQVIRYLRQHSNYLTPRAGLFTADTWSIIVTYIRNGLLNLLILICLIAALLLLPRLFAAISSTFSDAHIKQISLISAGFALYASYILGRNLGWYHLSQEKRKLFEDYKSKSFSTFSVISIVILFGINCILVFLLDSHTTPELLSIPHDLHKPLLDILKICLITTSFSLLAVLGHQYKDAICTSIADSQLTVLLKIVIPILFVASTSHFVLPLFVEHQTGNLSGILTLKNLGIWSIATLIAHGTVWFAAYTGACSIFFKQTGTASHKEQQNTSEQDKTENKVIYNKTWNIVYMSALLSGLIMGPLLLVLSALIKNADVFNRLNIVGAPLFLIWLFLLSVLHTGLIGRGFSTGEREWLNRLGAWLLIVAFACLLINGLSFYSPLLMDLLYSHTIIQTFLASGWLFTTLAGLLLNRETRGEKSSGVFSKLLLTIAPYVFLLGLIALISSGINALISTSAKSTDSGGNFSKIQSVYQHSKNTFSLSVEDTESGQGDTQSSIQPVSTGLKQVTRTYHALLNAQETHPLLIALILLILTLIISLLSRCIDINEFSLHRLYGNRLTRCYLGASVKDRKPHPFTGFSKQDDIDLHTCISTTDDQQPQAIGPYHIVNTAINLVSGSDLAWQERKAASFTLSPLFCGFEPINFAKTSKKSETLSEYGFRPTRSFACSKPGKNKQLDQHLTLGDAMTISGAAASPNMGSHSSKVFSFLLAIFNIRLGRWTGNPRHNSTYRFSGPKSSMKLLIDEILGLTKSTTDYVYLSDGGHFENLGIYELIRRRCRFIIAVDAGADPQFRFDDLGNAIRKCRNDFGVSIDIDVSRIQEREAERFNVWPCAIGTIHYSDSQTGTLLYIKSSLLNDAPMDVLNYASQNPSFPHETTGDQFFTESQFESYRYLGYHIGMKVLSDASFNNQQSK
ncbi:MAG: hypothetical protein K0U68_02795 [Gammaproteobacteria bacterium]|nr:hypothetical protein [Gammaproteobacteria bacterium]